jgi:tetratricopeptide (TPR) repeat protein
MHSTTNQPQKIAFEAAISDGQILQASDIASRAVAWYERQGDGDNAGDWLCQLANSFIMHAKYSEAGVAASRAAEIYTTLINRGAALHFVALSQVGLFQFTHALITLGQVEEIARFFPDDLLIRARIQIVRALAYFNVGDIDNALSGWAAGADLQIRNGRLSQAALSYNNLGYTLLQQNKLKEAEGWLLRALKLLEKQRQGHTHAGVLDSLGYAYTLMGRYDNVRELENYIKQRVLFGETLLLQAVEFPGASTAWRKLSEAEKQQRLREALDQTNGHISQAAQWLGISRRTIQKLKKNSLPGLKILSDTL